MKRKKRLPGVFLAKCEAVSVMSEGYKTYPQTGRLIHPNEAALPPALLGGLG
ncbi:Uncharacterised protein [Legionella quinlivanii]|nr:Uncharacterised protein [Legionella quinlivanii]